MPALRSQSGSRIGSHAGTLVRHGGRDMTKAPMLRIVGFTAIALAVIGSLTSLSVVRAGGTDGAVYLTANIAVAVVGAILLLLASRGRQAQGKNPSAPSTTRAGAHPLAE